MFAAPDAAGEDGAVEIMTMHKSKGLQLRRSSSTACTVPRGDQAPLVRFEQNADRVLFGPVKPRAETEADPVSRYLGAREARRASYEVDRLLRGRARAQAPASGRPCVGGRRRTGQGPPAASLLGRLWPG